MLLPFTQGAALGFAAAASPGPFQAYLLSQALRLGAARALPAALAPLASDGPIIALVLLVLSGAPPGLLRALHGAGGLFLVWLAWGTARGAAAPAEGAAASGGAVRGFAQAVAMNALSPGPWIFWSLAAGPTLVEAWRRTPAEGLAFLGGFYLLLCGGNAAAVLLFAGARRLGPGAARTMALASAAALAAFGLHMLWKGIAG